MLSRVTVGTWFAAGVLFFCFVWQQIQSVRLGYKVEERRREVQLQREQNAYLRLAADRLLSPASLAQVAQQRLHMRPPAPESLVILDSEGKRLVSRVNTGAPVVSKS